MAMKAAFPFQDHLDGHVYLDRLEKEERREAMRYMRTHRK